MTSQVKSYFHNLDHLADFHLKWCMNGLTGTYNSTGRNVAICTFEKLSVPEPSRGFGQLLRHAFQEMENLIGANVPLKGSLGVNRIEPVKQESVALDVHPFMI